MARPEHAETNVNWDAPPTRQDWLGCDDIDQIPINKRERLADLENWMERFLYFYSGTDEPLSELGIRLYDQACQSIRNLRLELGITIEC